jgi:hypothetical protein
MYPSVHYAGETTRVAADHAPGLGAANEAAKPFNHPDWIFEFEPRRLSGAGAMGW